jgi:hypothetical protein
METFVYNLEGFAFECLTKTVKVFEILKLILIIHEENTKEITARCRWFCM